MTRRHKYSPAEAQLQPLATTVIFTALAVAGILLGIVGTDTAPAVQGAYKVTAAR